MVSITIGTAVRSCVADDVNGVTPGDSQVQLMPVFRPGMLPRHLMACLVPEKVVRYTQVVVAAEF